MKPTVIIDSSEQRPWSFDPAVFSTRVANLNTGDYTVEGFESTLCVERKSLADWVNTSTHDWIRFRKQLYRMACFDLALIVVEANVEDLFAVPKLYESDANPNSVWGRSSSCLIEHGVAVHWWGPPKRCQQRVADFMKLAIRKKL